VAPVVAAWTVLPGPVTWTPPVPPDDEPAPPPEPVAAGDVDAEVDVEVAVEPVPVEELPPPSPEHAPSAIAEAAAPAVRSQRTLFNRIESILVAAICGRHDVARRSRRRGAQLSLASNAVMMSTSGFTVTPR
jgi:hypothetical protein